jgi:hypothetical protein
MLTVGNGACARSAYPDAFCRPQSSAGWPRLRRTICPNVPGGVEGVRFSCTMSPLAGVATTRIAAAAAAPPTWVPTIECLESRAIDGVGCVDAAVYRPTPVGDSDFGALEIRPARVDFLERRMHLPH